MSVASLNCSNCQLSQLCFPGKLSQQEIGVFQEYISRSVPFHKGEYIYEFGQAFTGIYVLVSGTVKVYKLDPAGNKQIIGFHHAGEIFGLGSVSHANYQSSAVALDTAALCKLPFDCFDTLNRTLPDVGQQIIKLMSDQLNHNHILHLYLNKKTAEQKLAYFLVELNDRLKNKKLSENCFILPMSRTDIGNYLGLTIETISRFINKLQKNGFIKISGKQIEILNLNGLQQLVDH